jgi:hypothetical protein
MKKTKTKTKTKNEDFLAGGNDLTKMEYNQLAPK